MQLTSVRASYYSWETDMSNSHTTLHDTIVELRTYGYGGKWLGVSQQESGRSGVFKHEWGRGLFRRISISVYS